MASILRLINNVDPTVMSKRTGRLLSPSPVWSVNASSSVVLHGGGEHCHLATSAHIFDGHNWIACVCVYALDIRWMETRDAAKHPKGTRQPPTTEDYGTPNVGSAGSERMFWSHLATIHHASQLSLISEHAFPSSHL